MKKTKNIKITALTANIIAIVVLSAILIGTTFAWFTDSVTSANNIISSGNLNVEFEYWNGKEWVDVSDKDDILTNDLWEPGVTEVAYLKVKNAGSLALKYQLGINIVSETAGVNVAGETFKLSDYIMFGVVENVNGSTDAFTTREDALAAVEAEQKISAGYSKYGYMISGEEIYLALAVYMPTTVGDEANHNGVDVPSISLGLSVRASQVSSEEDSFNNEYDDGIFILGDNNELEIEEGDITVTLPSEAFDGFVTNPEISTPTIEKIIPTSIDEPVKYKITFDIKVDGLKNDNDIPCTVVCHVSPDIVSYLNGNIAVYHNGEAIRNPVFDDVSCTITFTTLSFSPFEIILNTDYLMIPEAYTNDEAVAMLKNATNDDKIDGNNRVIDLGSAGQNSWALSLTKSVSFANMTLKASGKGQVVIIQGKNQTVKMKNVMVQNTTSSGQSLVLSLNGATSQVFENCTFKGKAYFQGSNATFINCSFDKNNNMDSSATNFTFKGCKFTYSSAITMNANAKNILIEECTFSGSAIRIYSGMAQPENVRLMNNTYKGTALVSPDANIDYDGWKANGAWIEEGNKKA